MLVISLVSVTAFLLWIRVFHFSTCQQHPAVTTRQRNTIQQTSLLLETADGLSVRQNTTTLHDGENLRKAIPCAAQPIQGRSLMRPGRDVCQPIQTASQMMRSGTTESFNLLTGCMMRLRSRPTAL
eukprot:2718971-Rhodomonas_salina.4